MDVMEILTKVKFVCITLVVSLCTSPGFAQDEQRVERVKGEWIISDDITPLQAREKAIRQAKAEALRQAGVSEYVSESNLMFKTESSNKLRDIHESWTSIDVSGEISQFEVVDERKAINEFGNLSYEVWIDATVIRHQTSKDPGLNVDVNGIHESYHSPDELIFDIMPSKEGFLNIFILGEDESLHLYPNKFEKREKFEGGKLYKFPRSTALDYEVSSKDSMEVNYLVLLYTKVEIPFLEEETPEKILQFIAKIDPSQKWLKSYSILIRQK